jgi:predicted nucleic acid-binding protein
MKYVLDSSVALKWVLQEVDSGKAIRLRNEYSNGIHELLAADVFPPEIGNGLASAGLLRKDVDQNAHLGVVVR